MSKVDTQDAATEFMGRATKSQRIQALLHRYPWLSSALVLLIAIITFSFFNENFLTPGNMSLILQQVAIVGAIAAGQTLIILTAGIDLSCGAIAIFVSMVMAKSFGGAWDNPDDGKSFRQRCTACVLCGFCLSGCDIGCASDIIECDCGDLVCS